MSSDCPRLFVLTILHIKSVTLSLVMNSVVKVFKWMLHDQIWLEILEHLSYANWSRPQKHV
jgi:hypothetical protein